MDYCTVVCLPDRALVVTSPSTAQLLMQQLDFLIIREQVSLSELGSAGASGCFSLAGAGADQALQKAIGDAELPQAGKAVVASVGGHDVVVVHGSGLAAEGYLLITSSSAAAPLWEELRRVGAIGEGHRGWEAQRVADGVPAAGSELTLDYNPLEAGLWSAVSFDKGCYCGQETLARLRTYDGVKQHLVMSRNSYSRPSLSLPLAFAWLDSSVSRLLDSTVSRLLDSSVSRWLDSSVSRWLGGMTVSRRRRGGQR